MTYPPRLAARLDKIDEKVKKLLGEREHLIKENIRKCVHAVEHVRLLPYNATAIGNPWLVCSACGYSEEGWGCGYTKLKHAEYASLQTVAFEEWLDMALVRSRQEDRFP